jgi:hypothetical protein
MTEDHIQFMKHAIRRGFHEVGTALANSRGESSRDEDRLQSPAPEFPTSQPPGYFSPPPNPLEEQVPVLSTLEAPSQDLSTMCRPDCNEASAGPAFQDDFDFGPFVNFENP